MARGSFVQVGRLFLLGLVIGYLYEFLLHVTKEKDLENSIVYHDLPISTQSSCNCEEPKISSTPLNSAGYESPQTENSTLSFASSTPSPKSRLFNCSDTVPEFRMEQHDQYYVLYNVIPAQKWFHCDETITFATHGETNFLHNLMQLTARWHGPVSVAVYTPAPDYVEAMRVVKYLRDCTASGHLIKDLVTFHFFFSRNNIPEFLPTWKWQDLNESPLECALYTDDLLFLSEQDLFRVPAGLSYPVAVARNIAKEGATTALILHSDIDFMPSIDLIPDFLDLLHREPELVQNGLQESKSVFVVLSYYLHSKVAENQVPRTKAELLFLVRRVRAHLHKSCKCKKCAMFNAGYKGWMKVANGTELSVVTTIKRPDPHWSPFYISFKTVPFWDERFGVHHDSHGIQVASLCLLDYDFHILDGSFLVRAVSREKRKSEKINKEQYLSILREVEPQMYWLYGENPECLPDELHN